MLPAVKKLENKTCLIIVGPTAVGKTAAAITLAQHFHTEIISADSRQCYRELNIGVAKPSPAQLQRVKHWFIDSHSIHDDVNAVVFEQYATEKVNGVFMKNDIAIVTGGTGLYIKAFCEGLDDIPVIDPAIRNEINLTYKNEGMEWLSGKVEENDPLFFSTGEIQNPQRMMRALEVKLSTGRSIREFHTSKKQERDFTIVKIGMEMPKDQLYININGRVDLMMENGLLEEVKKLTEYKTLNALQTVGYKELLDHLDGDISLDEAVERIKVNTRHYAKRQMTWFKKDKEIRWVSADEDEFIESIKKSLPVW